MITLLVSMSFGKEAEVVVLLKNGDRISGSLTSSSGEVVVVRSSLFGELKIKRSEIRKLDETSPAKKKAFASSKELKPEIPSTVVKEDIGTKGWLVGALGVVQLADWKQRLEFGMNLQSGRRDKNDFSLRYDMRKKEGKIDQRIQTRILYGETNSDKTTDRAFANYRWRRDISPGVFYESLSSYSFDAIKEIDHNLEQKLGVGYRWVNTDSFKFSTGGGSSGRYRDIAANDAEFSYLVDLFEDIDYRLNKRLRVTQELRFAVPPDETDAYELNFRAAMISDITDSLNLTIRYQLEYDKSLPRDRREDQRLISAIGMDF